MTATKTKPTDPAAELAPINEQLQAAREERSRLGQEYRVWEDDVVRLQAELDQLAGTDASQFGPDGQPKIKTHADELKNEITKRTTGQRWPQLVQGADENIRVLEAELSRATEASAEELCRAEYEGRGRAVVEKLRKAAALILEAYEENTASTSFHMGIVNSVGGLNGQDIFSDPIIREAREMAERLVEVQPPRSVCLVPLTTDDPPRVRSVNGGFIRAGAKAEDISKVQPQRVERI